MPEAPSNPDVQVGTLQLRAPSSLALGDPQQLAHDVVLALSEALGPDARATLGGMRLRLHEHELRHQPANAIARAIVRQLRNTKETPR